MTLVGFFLLDSTKNSNLLWQFLISFGVIWSIVLENRKNIQGFALCCVSTDLQKKDLLRNGHKRTRGSTWLENDYHLCALWGKHLQSDFEKITIFIIFFVDSKERIFLFYRETGWCQTNFVHIFGFFDSKYIYLHFMSNLFTICLFFFVS